MEGLLFLTISLLCFDICFTCCACSQAGHVLQMLHPIFSFEMLPKLHQPGHAFANGEQNKVASGTVSREGQRQ